MNEEELRKEAKEYANKKVPKAEMPIRWNIIYTAYLAGAEPREKHIEELEAQIKEMKCCGNCENEDDDSWHDSPCEGCECYAHWQLRR